MIPFNKASLSSLEYEYLSAAINRGHISGCGPFTRQAEEILTEIHGRGRSLLTTSCTHALELSALLLNLKSGDEVIVPSYTFVSTASAFALHGATPVFADIDPMTLGLSLDTIVRVTSERTKAVCVVHYAGFSSEIDRIADFCSERDIVLIEDNAHGFLGTFRGRPLGTFGSLSTLSFHETKNITCGEGGALHINDLSLLERSEILREKGTDRSRFFRGQVYKYTWV
jgi:dTDP-4-amino-4,6-dideoxygalactose transaminase